MKVKRTYPQPDSPSENIGPRERALAVFKYLLDLEPEAAGKHEMFPLIMAAFEQEGRRATRNWIVRTARQGDAPEALPSVVKMLTGESEGTARVQPFAKDGI